MSDRAENVVPFPSPAPVAQKRPRPARRTGRAGRVLAVGGGKGGIGKSLVSANLGIALAQRGARVVLVDCDLGGANLHTCLGVNAGQQSISDFISRKVENIEEVLTPTGIERLSLVSGAHDVLDAANPRHAQKARLLRHVRTLDVDYVLLDLGAGTSFNVLDFFLAADLGIVVLLPEPTSIENAYRFIKAAFFRRLQSLTGPEIAEHVAAVLAGRDPQVRTPWELVERLRDTQPEVAIKLELSLGGFHPWVVVNQARARTDWDVGQSVTSAWKKIFGLDLGYLGAVAHDDSVWKAVRARQPLLRAFPESPASQAILRVAENVLSLEP